MAYMFDSLFYQPDKLKLKEEKEKKKSLLSEETLNEEMIDKFYSTNTEGYYDSSDPQNWGRLAKDYAKAIPKGIAQSGVYLADIPSLPAYATGLLGYGIDKAWGGIEPEGMDYYDYVPHLDVDLLRGKTPYENMGIFKPYGTIIEKGINYGVHSLNPNENKEELSSPWLAPGYLEQSKVQVGNQDDLSRLIPDPSSIQNITEFFSMGLTAGTGYFSQVPKYVTLMKNAKSHGSLGAGVGFTNSFFKELFPEWQENPDEYWKDSTQTMALIGINLIGDLMIRKSNKPIDDFVAMGLTSKEADDLNKVLPKIRQILDGQKHLDGATPQEVWQFINRIDSPGLKKYLRLLSQEDQRFVMTNVEQAQKSLDNLDTIYGNDFLSTKGIFNNTIDRWDAVAEADDFFSAFRVTRNNNFKNTMGNDFYTDLSLQHKIELQKILDNFKYTERYKGLDDMPRLEVIEMIKQLSQAKNLSQIDNIIRKGNWTTSRQQGQVGTELINKQGTSAVLDDLSIRVKEYFKENFTDSEGTKIYKNALEEFSSSTEKFAKNTPSYKFVEAIKSSNNVEEKITLSIDALMNKNITSGQLREIVTVMEEIGGNKLVPDLMAIHFERTMKDIAKVTDDSTTRVTGFYKAIGENSQDNKRIHEIVEIISGNKNQAENTMVVKSITDWMDYSLRIQKQKGESMTAVYHAFIQDIGLKGQLAKVNPFMWSTVVQNKYKDWAIKRLSEQMTDPYFLEQVIHIRKNAPDQQGWVEYITRSILSQSNKNKTTQLAEDEKRKETLRNDVWESQRNRKNEQQNQSTELEYTF